MHLLLHHVLKTAEALPVKKKKPNALPWLGAGAAASLPVASLAQYYGTDYPAYKHVLETAPITTGEPTDSPDNYSKSFDQFLGKLKPGDIMAEMTDPAKSPLSTRGAGTPTGGPFFHSAIVGAAGPEDKSYGDNFNNDVRLLEGGWVWPDPKKYLNKGLADKAKQFSNDTVYSPHVFDHLFTFGSNLHVLDDAHVRSNAPFTQKITQMFNNRNDVLAGLSRDWNKQMIEDPAAAKEILQKMPTPPVPEIKSDVLSDAATTIEEPTLFMRPPNSGTPSFNKFLDKQLGASTKQPYSDQAAIESSLKRVFLPSQGPHKIQPDLTPTHNSVGYCAAPSGSFLKGLGIPSRGGSQYVMPADAVSNPALKPVGIYVPGDAGLGADPRSKLLQWLETAKKYRTRSGLLATGLMAAGGYGVTRGLQALLARDRERKAKQQAMPV